MFQNGTIAFLVVKIHAYVRHMFMKLVCNHTFVCAMQRRVFASNM